MRDQINYNKSIKRRELSITTDFVTRIVDYLVHISIIGLPVYGAWIYVSRLIRSNIYYHHWTEISILCIFSLAWIVYLLIWLKRVDKFNIIQGIDRKINRQIVAETLIYKEWHILHNNKDFIVAFPDTGFFKADRQVSILFDDNKILLNVTTYSWRNLKSPFFEIMNIKTRKELVENFEDRILKTLPNNGS